MPLTVVALGVVAVGAVLPAAPRAHVLGFQPLPGGFFAALVVRVLGYLALIELGKRYFYGTAAAGGQGTRRDGPGRHLRRRAARFSAGPAAAS